MPATAIRIPRSVRLYMSGIDDDEQARVHAALDAAAQQPFESWPNGAIHGFVPRLGNKIIRVPPDYLVFVELDAAGEPYVLVIMHEQNVIEAVRQMVKAEVAG